jgi:hypothetical protein
MVGWDGLRSEQLQESRYRKVAKKRWYTPDHNHQLSADYLPQWLVGMEKEVRSLRGRSLELNTKWTITNAALVVCHNGWDGESAQLHERGEECPNAARVEKEGYKGYDFVRATKSTRVAFHRNSVSNMATVKRKALQMYCNTSQFLYAPKTLSRA